MGNVIDKFCCTCFPNVSGKITIPPDPDDIRTMVRWATISARPGRPGKGWKFRSRKKLALPSSSARVESHKPPPQTSIQIFNDNPIPMPTCLCILEEIYREHAKSGNLTQPKPHKFDPRAFIEPEPSEAGVKSVTSNNSSPPALTDSDIVSPTPPSQDTQQKRILGSPTYSRKFQKRESSRTSTRHSRSAASNTHQNVPEEIQTSMETDSLLPIKSNQQQQRKVANSEPVLRKNGRLHQFLRGKPSVCEPESGNLRRPLLKESEQSQNIQQHLSDSSSLAAAARAFMPKSPSLHALDAFSAVSGSLRLAKSPEVRREQFIFKKSSPVSESTSIKSDTPKRTCSSTTSLVSLTSPGSIEMPQTSIRRKLVYSGGLETSYHQIPDSPVTLHKEQHL